MGFQSTGPLKLGGLRRPPSPILPVDHGLETSVNNGNLAVKGSTRSPTYYDLPLTAYPLRI